MKNLMKGITLMLLLGLTVSVFAQHRGHRGPHGGNLIEKFKADLNLTPEQEVQITELQAKQKAAMQNLKDTDYEDPTDRREAMHELMKEHKAALAEILTDEQEAILKEKMQEMHQARKERMGKVDHKALRQEMKQYREENMMPTLRAQRAKLETKISTEDKKAIADLRAKFEQAHAERKAMKKEMKKEDGPRSFDKEKIKGFKEEHKAEREQVKALVEKYQDDIDALMEEIAPQREQWQQDMKAIGEKYRPEAPEGEKVEGKKGKGKRGHGDHHRLGHKGMKSAHFLLMNPDAPAEAPATDTGQAWTKVTTYPNPAVSSNQMDYSVVKAGQIRIELHNDSGNLVQVLLNEYKQPGDYTLNVDLGSFRSGSYYLIVKDEGGVSSQKVVVAK